VLIPGLAMQFGGFPATEDAASPFTKWAEKMYHADVMEHEAGKFLATLRGHKIRAISSDPEHDLCYAMAQAFMTDGPIQFWRGSTPSLLYRSVHKAAQYRIKLGDSFPYERVKREEMTQEDKDRARARSQTGEKEKLIAALPPNAVPVPGGRR
jgi:hypothetical protein